MRICENNTVLAKSDFWSKTRQGIPKSDRHVESFLGDIVTDSIFLNPVTDEELLNIVHNAKDKKAKGYDGIDMCMLKKSFRTS